MRNPILVAALLAAMSFIAVDSAEARGLLRATAAPEAVPTPDVLAAAPVGPCVCCPPPCIRYRNAIFDLKRVCCDPCKPPLASVLCVKNPCTCCPVEVPVCLPSCCCGEPKVTCRKTLVGSGTVTFAWCCGVSVVVRFDKCGDVLVTYRGV